MKKKEQSPIVVKSNDLVNASYHLTLNEQRLILLAIVVAREKGTGFGEGKITVTAKDYAEAYGIAPHHAYEYLRDAVKQLYNRSITIESITPTGRRRLTDVRWLQLGSYVEQEGEVTLCFSTIISPFISALEEKFTRYDLKQVADMTSTYAVRMYEVFVFWLSNRRNEVELEVRRLKEMLCLEGYARVTHLKEKVVDVAIRQINQYSDIVASYDQKKLGRVITHFVFNVDYKKPKAEAKPAVEIKPKPPRKAQAVAPPPVTPEPPPRQPRTMPSSIKETLNRFIDSTAPQPHPAPVEAPVAAALTSESRRAFILRNLEKADLPDRLREMFIVELQKLG